MSVTTVSSTINNIDKGCRIGLNLASVDLVEGKIVMENKVKENLSRIQEEIAPYRPNIIAVTKYFDGAVIESAYQAGLRNFAESRAIEAVDKIKQLPAEIRGNSTFHFIGHLQTNKVKKVVEYFDFIQSVDSLKIAQCISDIAKGFGKKQRVLLEVNISDEPQKYGFSKPELREIFQSIMQMESLEVAGLMCMAPLGAEETVIRDIYTQAAQIKRSLELECNCRMDELSMGMSQDYLIAVECGATMLRIGRKLFS